MKWQQAVLIGIAALLSCAEKTELALSVPKETIRQKADTTKTISIVEVVPYPVTIGQYFPYLDSLILKYDTLLNYQIDEHILIRANDWVIDRLRNTDYYLLAEQGVFSYDNRALPILNTGDTLIIPDSMATQQICNDFDRTTIDLNIPEFKLRIVEHGKVKHHMLVRVGRNERKYLQLAGRTVDLRTANGQGYIYRIERDPIFINPSNGKRFYTTKRDDGQRTRMPQLPWLEPELDGRRYGHLIHPTSNPKTLGKAYSNGCVGLGEADTWLLYYHAPVGTKVIFRYDLEVVNEEGDTLKLKNIYNRKQTTF